MTTHNSVYFVVYIAREHRLNKTLPLYNVRVKLSYLSLLSFLFLESQCFFLCKKSIFLHLWFLLGFLRG